MHYGNENFRENVLSLIFMKIMPQCQIGFISYKQEYDFSWLWGEKQLDLFHEIHSQVPTLICISKSFQISGQCCSSDKHAHTHIDLCLETRKIDQSKPHLNTLLRLNNKQTCLSIWTIRNSESLAKLVTRQKCIGLELIRRQ